MKKVIYLFIIILFFNCAHRDEYKLALHNYVREDLAFKQFMINEHLPFYAIYNPDKIEDAFIFNKICLSFENAVFNLKSIDSINIKYHKFKDSLNKKLATKQPLIINKIKSLPNRINTLTEKYSLLRKLKKINYEFINLEINKTNYSPEKQKTAVLAIRLNKEVVIINFYNSLAKGYGLYFNEQSFNIEKLEDIHKNRIQIIPSDKNIFESYAFKTTSDTIYLNALLTTKKETGLLVSENNSYIVVGEYKTFDNHYLDDYFNSK